MKISIITATWNSGATIRHTVESVLAQSHTDWEHIIVDGLSSDNTLAIVREYADKYAGRLVIISEKDRGIYDAMNKGIRAASGQVIGILNSDDFYTSTSVLKTIATEFKDFDAVYADIHFVNPDNLEKCVRYYSSRHFRPWHMIMGFMPAHPSFYCKSDVYEKYGMFDLEFRIAADFEQLLRLIYINHIHTHYIESDFVTMRTGGASTSGWQSHKRILKDHLRAYRKNGVRSGLALESVRYFIKTLQLIRDKFKY